MNPAQRVGLFGTLVRSHDASASRGFVPRAAHGAISGRITDAVTGEPARGARLVLRLLRASARSPGESTDARVLDADDEGRFIGTRFAPGCWRVQVPGGVAIELHIRAGETARASLATMRSS